jgi:hypothetical protein
VAGFHIGEDVGNSTFPLSRKATKKYGNPYVLGTTFSTYQHVLLCCRAKSWIEKPVENQLIFMKIGEQRFLVNRPVKFEFFLKNLNKKF